MSEIYVKENESLDNALKRFKRSCAKAGVLADLRKKEYYQSPSVKRRKKSEAARKNKRRYNYKRYKQKDSSMSCPFLFSRIQSAGTDLTRAGLFNILPSYCL